MPFVQLIILDPASIKIIVMPLEAQKCHRFTQCGSSNQFYSRKLLLWITLIDE